MKQATKKLNILRLLAILVICSTLLGSFALTASAIESGECGEGIDWVFEAGTLTLTGSGDMKNFKDAELPPWYEFRNDIVRLSISDQITSIGSYAFYGCSNLISVSLPRGVKSIGSYAFAACERLASIQLSNALTTIGDGAFYNCYALQAIRLPYGLSHIGRQAFYRCESLRCISIPSNVRSMGNSVFAYCSSLVRAEVYARISELPTWTFYGCSRLSEVYLSDMIGEIGNYGFKKCESLSTVHFSGTENKAQEIEDQISEDVGSFAVTGYVTKEEMAPSTSSGTYVEKDEKTAVQTDTVVVQNDKIIMGYEVERTYEKESDKKGTYTAEIFVTVESNENWQNATEEINKALENISNTYRNLADPVKVVATVYLENDVTMSRSFLNNLAGKDLQLVVQLANGSKWSVTCRELKADTSGESSSTNVNDYSYTLKEAAPEVYEQIASDNCYRLIFDESSEQKAEVVVQLPTQTSALTNAYLYQVEDDGSYKKLQAVAVDREGCAHFYISSVNKYNDYVIGLDVAGESTSDVIIPETLIPQMPELDPESSALVSALQRLEQVPYVEMGRNYAAVGFGYNTLLWVVIGVLIATTVAVGGVMFVWNKSRKNKLKKNIA